MMIISLAVMTAGLGLGLYGFRDAGLIGDELFVAAAIMISAVPIGVFVAMDLERRARRRARSGFGNTGIREVPPPFDVYKVWPVDPARRTGRNSAKDR